MQKLFSKILVRPLAFVAAIALSLFCTTNAFAANTTDTGSGSASGNVAVNGTLNAVTISVTHPATVAYSFDPNTGASGTFTAPTLTVTNNTKCPINVAVTSLQATTGGALTLTDVDPTSKSWATLNNSDSKKYCALGILVPTTPGAWNAGYLTTTRWSYSTGNWAVGSLNTTTSGNLTLTGDFGLAFDNTYTANHTIAFSFSLV